MEDEAIEALHGIAMDLPHAGPTDTVPTEWGRIDKRVQTVYAEIDRLRARQERVREVLERLSDEVMGYLNGESPRNAMYQPAADAQDLLEEMADD